MRMVPRYVGVDRGYEARLPELAQDYAAERGLTEGRRAEGNQGFSAGLLKAVPRRDGNPLGQHRERATSLLVLRQGLPLTLEDRERRRMERIACLEARAQKVA